MASPKKDKAAAQNNIEVGEKDKEEKPKDVAVAQKDKEADKNDKAPAPLGNVLAIGLTAVGAAAGMYLLSKLASHTKSVPYAQSASDDIGINLNKWQHPVKDFSSADENLEDRLNSLECVGELDISQKVWDNATNLVDEVLDLLMVKMREQALKYEGLVFDGYRKQGSARDGLKIRSPDEFDVLLEYHIERLYVEPVPIVDFGIPRPGLGRMKILNEDCEIETQFATWIRRKIIVRDQDSYFLKARNLHQTVFESIMDKCLEKLSRITRQNISFRLIRSMNPPSVNLTITDIQREKGSLESFMDWLFTDEDDPDVIDIDVVPAMMIVTEKARGTSGFMPCPRYAVVKWMEESQTLASRFEDPSMTWRICTSGYEKHCMDMARNDKKKRYIMTACRIIKTFMSKERDKSRAGENHLYISTFLRSFYLKNITFYCMLFTESVTGVYQALGYFLGFLEISLEEECLPEFFHGNYLLDNDFPSCAVGGQVNLFGHVSPDTLINAKRSFKTVKSKLYNMFDESVLESSACQKFQNFVKSSK
ncbi:hypothetical protein ACJMK2_026715 [Sinanodonta woodiana]|uniref:Mab-21-like nucleotidyltransferase domain-containing protein n=1 Tax=Sinanodonta woodiana TaxID=1069815 RepID=A0ABD3XKW9_SINWO